MELWTVRRRSRRWLEVCLKLITEKYNGASGGDLARGEIQQRQFATIQERAPADMRSSTEDKAGSVPGPVTQIL